MKSSFSTKLKVGITSFISIFILFGGILWIKEYNPTVKKEKITVLFNDAKGISTGDPVNLAGIKIGNITNVYLSENNKAFIEMSINKKVRLYSDCAFIIKDVGLMGDKALIIFPGSEGTELNLSEIHKGTDSFDLDDLFANADDVLKKLNRISSKIDNDLDIKRITESFMQTFSKMQQAIAIYKDIAQDNREPLKKSITSLEVSADNLQHFIQKTDDRFENAIDSFQRTSDKISLALDNIENLSTVIDTLSVYIKSGEGTLGKMVKSGELYEELRRTNASIDSFITDFKLNPGKYTKDMKFKLRLF